MRRAVLLFLVTAALLLGGATGEYLTTNFSFRRGLGRFVRHDQLLALVGRDGIYQSDLQRAWAAKLFATGAEPADVDPAIAAEDKRALLDQLIALRNVRAAAARQAIDGRVVEREFELIRSQFGEERWWSAALRDGGLSARALRREIAEQVRTRSWIERQLAATPAQNENACRQFYSSHRALFSQPPRLRASQLFLAAPDGYPAELIEAKRASIYQLAQRLRKGEAFAQLVAEFSEDEASKKTGGDLNYFAAQRMLPEVFAAAQQLRPGEISAPIRSRLGFHILRLTAALPASQIPFDAAREEIVIRLENDARAQRVAAITSAR